MSSMTPGAFGNQKRSGGVTAKGRVIIGLLFAAVLALAFFGYSAVSKYAAKSGGGNAASSSGGGLLDKFFGTKADISVCVVTWGGYVGGQYFNNGFKASKDSRYYTQYGFTVEFKVIDDFGPSRDAWKGDQCQVLWITADSVVTEVIGLREGGHGPKIFFQADNSRGGDVFIGSHGIKSVQDLRGKKVAFLPDSPSHTLLLNALDAANMTVNDIIPVETPGAPQAAEAFKAGNADAAVVWSPDDADCLAKVPGAHVLMSTKQATNIIADVFYAKEKFIDGHLEQLTGLVEGWLTGAAEINSDPAAKDRAADILVAGLSNIDKAYAVNAINNTRLSTYGDNLNFFGLSTGFKGVKGEDLYSKMAGMYTVAGKVSGNPPAWRDIVDLRVLKAVKLQATGAHAAENSFKFTAPTPELATAQAIASKGLTVTFPTGSFKLDDNAKVVIDLGFAHTAKGFAAERVRIEGNTDDVGDPLRNKKLSLDRAKSVAAYLTEKYAFDPNRFVIVGNGQDEPVCSEPTDDCRSKNRRTDFQLINN